MNPRFVSPVRRACLAGMAALCAAGAGPQTRNVAHVQVLAPTFEALAAAELGTGLRVEQVRRTRAADGSMAGIRERLEYRPDEPTPRFSLDPIGREFGSLSVQGLARLQSQYAQRAGFIHNYQGFHVADPLLAEENYRIVPLDTKLRLDRLVDRVLVMPRVLDRATWVLEVDRRTRCVLYQAEFDTSYRLVYELEVMSFDVLDRASVFEPRNFGWSGAYSTTYYESPVDARAALGADGDSMAIPGASVLPSGYRNHEAFVARGLVNVERNNLVLGYTDGVDEVFVIQDEGTDPLAILPSASSSNGHPTHTVTRFVDENVRQYFFQHGDVGTILTGSASTVALDAMAKGFYASVLP